MVKKGKFFGGKSIFEFLSQKKNEKTTVCLGPDKHVMNHLTGRKQQILWLFLDFLEM